MRILLVEDDNMIGHSLRQALSETGLSVDWVRDGVLAESALAQGTYAAVLLDLGLPRRSGLEVLRRARQEGNRTPMLVLTARDGSTRRRSCAVDDRDGADTTRPGNASARARRHGGRSFGARVSFDACVVGAAGCHRVARTAGRAHLRLG